MHGPRILCIGGGNMARALIEGSRRAGILTSSDWAVAEPDEAKRRYLDSLGIVTAPVATALPLLRNRDGVAAQGSTTAATRESLILLAVKPQSLDEVARDAANLDLSDRIVISILAGTPSVRVRAALGGRCRIIRAMPNLPASLGQGCTAIALGEGARPGDEAFALRLFSAIGPVVERIDESLMDAFTAVAGSGPAYLFYLAEAMQRAAVSLGFDPAAADRIVRQVIAGSAALLAASPDRAPADLRAAVTSKGGTTEAACNSLDADEVMQAFIRALTAARDRGRALAGGSHQ